MKKFLFYFAALILGSLFISNKAQAADSAPLHYLLPVPTEVTWQEGELAITPSFTFTITGVKEPRVEKAAQRFLERLEKRTKLTFSNGSEKAVLEINCEKPGLPVQSVREDESYALTVSSDKVNLSAPNPLGILRGLETLLQLVERKEGDQYVIPCAAIHDRPRFAWRGLLIDICRHWMPVEVIKRNLDGLAEAKMNVLHWHLSENQGFRVESKKHPKLQELGSDGKFYTQEQIKEIVAYARDRGIRIIPEFDMPGHSTSWMVGYPELAGAPGPYQLARKYDGSGPSPAFDPTREEIYEFIDSFVGEMTELFPDEYFHIGGDEVSGKQWNGNPEIQAFMYQHNMKTNEDLQAYFNSRLLKILTKHHRKMVGWDEILQPGLPKTIVVHSWRGADSLVESAKKGYDTILSNGYYLDNIRSAAFHYNVDPLPAKGDLTSEQKSHILGGEACMWSEFVTPETIDSRIWPRVLAVAERLWSPASVKDVDNFYDRMEVESGRLGELGLTHLSNYIPMLKSLVGNQPVEPLKVLADVVEPLKLYERPEGMAYSTETPLNHLVDAVRPESLTARAFRISVDSYLKEPPRFGDFEGLQELLRIWKDNHKSLEPILIKAHLSPVAAQSRDLSIIAQLGLEALRFLKAGKPAPAAWQEKASQALTRAQQPQAEVEIAVISPIRKLTLAAGQLDKLKGSTGEKWNKSLDDQVKTAKRESWE